MRGPYIFVQPGETKVLAEADGPGIINHIWMTPVGDYRLMILRFYWDGEVERQSDKDVMLYDPLVSDLSPCVVHVQATVGVVG